MRHSVGVQQGWKIEPEVRANWVIVSASIKGQIERLTNTTFEESKTTSREVEIHGGNNPIKLVWIEHFIT